MSTQDDVLKGIKSDIFEAPWRPGARNFSAKVIILEGEQFTLFKALHRYDGAVAVRVKGDVRNDKAGRDTVARVLAALAEQVAAGRVRFE